MSYINKIVCCNVIPTVERRRQISATILGQSLDWDSVVVNPALARDLRHMKIAGKPVNQSMETGISYL